MKVLIATDGSEFSKAAIEKICQRTLNAMDEIKIVSVVEPFKMVVGAPFGVMNDYYQELKREAFKLAENYVAQAETQIRRYLPDQKLTTEILYDNAAQAIVENAGEWGADLIVVGSHGRGFWARTVLGSVSGAVVNHAPCSVLVMRKQESAVEETR